MPFFKSTTPVDSKTRPINRMKSSLNISQVLVTNQFNTKLADQSVDLRTDERIKLMPKLLERRMRVKLRIASRQNAEQFQHVRFVHARVFQQTKNALSVADVFAPKACLCEPAKGKKNDRVRRTIQPAASGEERVHPKRLASQAHVADAEFVCVLYQQLEHGRMQMQVQVAIDVIEQQARGVKSLELRMDFGTQLLAQTLPDEIADAGADRIVAELAVSIGQAGSLFGRKRRVSA